MKLMNRLLLIAVIGLLSACGRSRPASVPAADTLAGQVVAVVPAVRDTTIAFLWRENRYDAELKDSVSTIVINEAYCRNIPDAEKAALGFVATFIGSECWWDGDANEAFSNLKCKILTALGLGYQCSEQHLGFLKKWFRSDKQALEQLGNCPTVPYTATVQESFDEISLSIKDREIIVSFKATGVNVRAGESWSWEEQDHFRVTGSELQLLKADKGAVKHEKF